MLMNAGIAALKQELRVDALARRDELPANDRRLWSQEIAAQVIAMPLFRDHAGPIAGFWPIGSEIDVSEILSAAEHSGRSLCLPAVVKNELVFRRWHNGSPLVPRAFGTWVPEPSAPVVEPTLLIVPMAAFDLNCGRLGYGKGFYDRAIIRLRALHGHIATIGVAFGAQEVETLPMEPWDQPLDCIVTERGILTKE